jgi:REP element-mobilizing transposase RayT
VPRLPRIEVPGGYYHLTSRGNNAQPIYWRDRDRVDFLALLDRVVLTHGWACLAYCLMTNHFHLLVQLDEGGLSLGMQTLNGWYARCINRAYGRTGHLFRNRFSGTLIESEEHLLAACRYVVLNPVRAGLCATPEHWPWSSYRATVGLARPPRLLAVDELLRRFARDRRVAQARFREFVLAGIAENQPLDTSDRADA